MCRMKERPPVGLGVHSVLQIRRGKSNNLGIIFHITPFIHILWPFIRTVSPRRF